MAIIVLLGLILTGISCAPAEEGGFLKVFDSSAEARIAGERNGIDFEAEVVLSARGEDGMRDGQMTFIEPAAMRGIKVSMASGVFGTELDGISFSGLPAELLGAPLKVFMQTGNAVSAEKITAEDGRMLTRIVIASDSGRIEYMIDSKTGIPVSVREEDGKGTLVMEFEIKEYEIIQ